MYEKFCVKIDISILIIYFHPIIDNGFFFQVENWWQTPLKLIAMIQKHAEFQFKTSNLKHSVGDHNYEQYHQRYWFTEILL